MKAKPDTAAKLRALIRWTTGTLVAAAIIIGASVLFPILSSFTALTLTICLSAFIGLNIALPPMDPEDDWVPIRSTIAEESVEEIIATQAEVKEASVKESEKIRSFPEIEVLPVHARRATGTYSSSWHMAHPEFLKSRDEAHGITLSKSPKRHSQVLHFPAKKKG